MGLEDSPLGRQSVANVEKCSGSLFTATQAFYGSGNKWLRRALFSRQPREYVNSHDENAEGCPRPESGGRIINPMRDRKLFKTINNCTIREVMTKYTHTHTRVHPQRKTKSNRWRTKQCGVKTFAYQTQDAGCLFGLMWIQLCWILSHT